MMQIKETTVFNFNSVQDGTTYNFSIPAETKELACTKLLKALQAVIAELQDALKPGTKAN
jgi:hypothetical protein